MDFTEIPFRQICVTRSGRVMWTASRMGSRGMKLHLYNCDIVAGLCPFFIP